MARLHLPASILPHRNNLLATVVLCLLFPTGAARGAAPVPQPVGPVVPLALNAYDAAQDVFDANYEVHLLPTDGGDRLAIWVRWANVDGSQNEVVGRLFDDDDHPAGPRFQVNTATDGWQQNPSVARSGQRVLVAWRSSVGDANTVHARLLDDRGAPLTEAVKVADSGFPPAAALGPSGQGLVLWTVYAGGDFTVYGRTMSPGGVLSPGQFPLTSFPPGSVKSEPSAGADGAGRFLVVWRSWMQVGPGAGIFGRWFSSSGSPLAPELQIHQQVIPSQGNPQVAVAADGSAVVAWDACDFSDPSFLCEVRARAYAADGSPRGPEMRVSPLDGLNHENAAVAIDARGDWAVAFESCHTDTGDDRYDCGVTTAIYSPDDQPLGAPVRVTPQGQPVEPSVAATADGFQVGWDIVSCDSRDCDSEPEGVYTQRYALVDPDQDPPVPDGEPLVASEVPGFRFWVRIGGAASTIPVRAEAACIPETLCVSGALPGRSEIFLRVVGPKGNGYLWPTIVKFTTSEVEVWIEQIATGVVRYYHLDGATPGSSELPGLFDRTGF